MHQEKLIRICKKCGVIQEKIQHGRFQSNDKRWRDPAGAMWAGNLCPICHRARMKEYSQKRRAEAKNVQK